MIYFVFTVDGDWDEYNNIRLSEEQRLPIRERMLAFFEEETHLLKKLINGKFIHFIHTSPRARTFFLQPEFINIWKKIVENGGDIGVHVHEDDPGTAYYWNDADRMKEAIVPFVAHLRSNGLNPIAYRGGYFAYGSQTNHILEECNIKLEFSCNPIRFSERNGQLIADWRGAPLNWYKLDYDDPRKPWQSQVTEIPLGSDGQKVLYIENESIEDMENVAKFLHKQDGKDGKDTIVALITHSYKFLPIFYSHYFPPLYGNQKRLAHRVRRSKLDFMLWPKLMSFTSIAFRNKLKQTIDILQRYGQFVNLTELIRLVE